MSFVKKAVKKVFKVVKKAVKKTVSFVKRVVKSDWFKVAAIVALSLFTAGVAFGGFAMGSAGGVTGFLQGVGATISQGFTAITGVIAKAGSAMSTMFTPAATGAGGGTFAAGAIGAEATAASGAVFGAGSTLAAAESVGLAALATPAASNAVGGGFLGKIGGMLSSSTGKYLMGNAVLGGIQSYYADKRAEVQEGYYRNRNIWGNAAYGGAADNPMDIMMPQFSKSSSVTGAAEQGLLPFERQQIADREAAAAQEPQAQGLLAQQADQAQQQAPGQAAGPGVPGQQTQPPPSTQPQQGQPPPPPGSQLENMV